MASPPRIDVHAHFLPPFYRDALIAAGHTKPDGMPAIPEWSVSAHLKLMETANIQKSILSISSPGTNLERWTNRHATITLTRQCNEYASKIKKKYPDKFGFWASLPLPHVEAALDEIDRAVEEGCDGFSLMTNYHGLYLGNAAFKRIFERLNDHGATVFIHPTVPWTCCGDESCEQPTKALPFGDEYPVPMFEFLFDTARTVIHLISSGTVDQTPNISFIIPHVGGTLPPLITRFIAFGSLVPGSQVLDPLQARKQLQTQFYFDLAGAIFDGNEGPWGQLKGFVDGFNVSSERLLYGSDFPFTRHESAMILSDRMNNGLAHLFNNAQVQAIYEGNAHKN